MKETELSSSDLQTQIQEKEALLRDLLTDVDELIERDIADEQSGATEVPHRFYASATYGESHGNDRMGLLSFTKQPDIDPHSFLEITYNEHGFGENRDETDTIYTFSRTNDGDTLVQVSDAISLDNFNAAITEAAEFESQVKGHDNTQEMLTQARDGFEADAREAIEQEKHEAGLSLRPATDDELAKLQEIISIAKTRTNWDRVKYGDVHESTADHDIDDSSARTSRIQKLGKQLRRLFAPSK